MREHKVLYESSKEEKDVKGAQRGFLLWDIKNVSVLNSIKGEQKLI